jgi:quinol monooxygenase YgiN
MKKTTKAAKGTIHLVSVLMIVATGLVAASIGSAASVHAQANNTSSSPAAKNMTSAASTGNNTRVIVTLDVKQGKKQEALKNLVNLIELAKKSPGYISYNIRASTDNPNELVLDELWSSKAAYDKYYNNPGTNQTRQPVVPLLDKPVQIKSYEEIKP